MFLFDEFAAILHFFKKNKKHVFYEKKLYETKTKNMVKSQPWSQRIFFSPEESLFPQFRARGGRRISSSVFQSRHPFSDTIITLFSGSVGGSKAVKGLLQACRGHSLQLPLHGQKGGGRQIQGHMA